MAGKACHVFRFTTLLGLTLVLAPMADHRDPQVQRQRRIGRFVSPWVVVPVFVLLLPLIVIRALARLTWSFLLLASAWAKHKKLVVFVYSDSPKWKEHVEKNILLALPRQAVIINRSRPWQKSSLAGRIFRHFGGHYDFCPIGIVVDRWRAAQVFRLFKPFQKAEYGDRTALDNTQAALLAATRSGR